MNNDNDPWRYDNLPAGTSWVNAPAMGVLPTDAPHIAASKVWLHEQQQQLQHAGGRSDSGSSSVTQPSTAPFHGGAAPRRARLDALSRGKILGTTGLAAHLESRWRQFESAREKTTHPWRRQMRLAGGVFAVCLVVILLNLQLPGLPYKFVAVEYFGVRLLAAASLFWFFHRRAAVKRAFSDEEKMLRAVANCTIEALKKHYPFKADTMKDARDRPTLLGRLQSPDFAFTADFLRDLADRIQQATGQPMPYRVYRFKEAFGQRLFIDLLGEDQLQWDQVERAAL